MEKDKQNYYILAGSYAKSEQEGIQLLFFDSVKGTIKRLGGISSVSSPAFLALDPERGRFFAVSEEGHGEVIAYTLDLKSGKIEEVNRQSTQGASLAI